MLSLDQFNDTATAWSDSMERFGDQRKSLLGNSAELSSQAQELSNALGDTLSIKLNKSSISMDDKNDIALALTSTKDNGTISVRISGTGDNCPIIE